MIDIVLLILVVDIILYEIFFLGNDDFLIFVVFFDYLILVVDE